MGQDTGGAKLAVVFIIVLDRVKDDRHTRTLPADSHGSTYAAKGVPSSLRALQLHVHQDNINIEFESFCHSFAPGSRLTDYLHSPRCLQALPQRLAQWSMIVNQ